MPGSGFEAHPVKSLISWILANNYREMLILQFDRGISGLFLRFCIIRGGEGEGRVGHRSGVEGEDEYRDSGASSRMTIYNPPKRSLDGAPAL